MSTVWPTKPLEELLENRTLSYGVVQPGRDDPDGVPIVRVKDLANGRISTSNPARVAEEISARHSRTTLTGGELLISVVGSVGETAVVPAALAGWNVARAIAVLRPTEVSAQWLRLALGASSAREYLSGVLNTTVQATLNLADLKRLHIPTPTSSVMDGITDVIGALDDKIGANDHLGRVVDEFVQSRFEQAAHGADRGELRQIASINTTTRKPVAGGHLRYLDIAAVGAGAYDFPAVTSWEDAPGRARRGVAVGDTVWSTVRPNRRSHALVLDEDRLLVASTGLAVLSPSPRRIAGLYEATRTAEFTAYLESVAEGSAYPAVRGERFAGAPIPDLGADDWDTFEAFALPLRIRVHAATVENRALTAVRNELLPLLMSGKVRVKDAEKVVEDVL